MLTARRSISRPLIDEQFLETPWYRRCRDHEYRALHVDALHRDVAGAV